MDTLSDMRPSNNYIINGFVSFTNMIQALWTLFIKLRAVKPVTYTLEFEHYTKRVEHNTKED